MAQSPETANSTPPANTKDILLALYPAPRNTAWEERVLKQHGDKLEIRYATTQTPDGTYLKPEQQDPKIFQDVTMYFSYLPAPAGKFRAATDIEAQALLIGLWFSIL